MRRIDKIKNIQKVNILTEQRQNAGRSIINESEESLPQFAGKLAQQHNIMLINQPMGKPELVKGFTDNKGIYPNNKDGVMAYQQSQNGGTISILSNNQDLNNAIFVQFKSSFGANDGGYETQQFNIANQICYFKSFNVPSPNNQQG